MVHPCPWRKKFGEFRAVLSHSIGSTTGVSLLLILDAWDPLTVWGNGYGRTEVLCRWPTSTSGGLGTAVVHGKPMGGACSASHGPHTDMAIRRSPLPGFLWHPRYLISMPLRGQIQRWTLPSLMKALASMDFSPRKVTAL
jgi:hypothetical protein